MHTPDFGVAKYILTELKGEIDRNSIVGYFKTPYSTTDKPSR